MTKDLATAALRGMNPNAGIWPTVGDPSITEARFADVNGNTLLALGQPDDLDAPVVIQTIDFGFPDINVITFPRPDADGEIDETATHAGKNVAMTLLIRGDDQHAPAWYLAALQGLSRPGARPYLYALENGWTAERRMMLRTDQFSSPLDRANGRAIMAQASYRAPDGAWESPSQSQVIVVPTTTAFVSGIGLHFKATSTPTVPVTGGVHFPATSTPTVPVSGGFHFIAGIGAGSTNVPVQGNDNVYPIVRIYGPISSPVLQNLTTGEELSFAGTPGSTLPGLVVASGDYVEIDMRNHTVYQTGNPILPKLNTLDFTVSTFWNLVPGSNIVSLAGSVVGTGCNAVVLWRDTWL